LIARSVHSEAAGLLAASIVFGLAHLPFGSFPNWKFALVGGISAPLGHYVMRKVLRRKEEDHE